MSDKDWAVGDRIQHIDYESKEAEKPIYGGVVTALTKATRQSNGGYYNRYSKTTEEYTSHVTVKWDNGEEETLDHYSVSPEDSEIEREFRKVAPSILDQINEKIGLAGKYLDEAEALAEEHGIPFSSCVSPLSQSYMTRSFPAKWDGVSVEVANSVTDTYGEGDYYGWQHSAVCY